MTQWAWETRLRSNVEMSANAVTVKPTSAELFRYPLLVLRGARGFGTMRARAHQRLGRHLRAGGMLFIDDAGLTGPSEAFDRSVRGLIKRALGKRLQPIPKTDVIYRTFYKLRRAVGRRADKQVFEGVKVGKRWAVVYSRNDVIGAFERDPRGGYTKAVIPGGARQRELAWRTAINVVIYSMCLDYKDDHSHVQYLLRRRRGR